MGHTTMGVIDFKSFNPPSTNHAPSNRKGNPTSKVGSKKFSNKFNKKAFGKKSNSTNFNPNSTLNSNPQTGNGDTRISFGNSFRRYNEKDEFTKHHSHDMNKKRAFGPAKSNFAQKRFNRGK